MMYISDAFESLSQSSSTNEGASTPADVASPTDRNSDNTKRNSPNSRRSSCGHSPSSRVDHGSRRRRASVSGASPLHTSNAKSPVGVERGRASVANGEVGENGEGAHVVGAIVEGKMDGSGRKSINSPPSKPPRIDTSRNPGVPTRYSSCIWFL